MPASQRTWGEEVVKSRGNPRSCNKTISESRAPTTGFFTHTSTIRIVIRDVRESVCTFVRVSAIIHSVQDQAVLMIEHWLDAVYDETASSVQ